MQVNVAEAKAKLSDIIARALAGEEIVIALRNKPVVRLVALETARSSPTFGCWKGKIWMSEDFDAPLEDFADDM